MPPLAGVGAAIAGAAANPIAPYLASGALGFLGNSTRQSTPGSGGRIVELPQYSFTEPRLRLISDTVSDMISRISRGEAPAYYERALPSIKSGMERGLQTTFFGRPGDRTGSVQAAMEAGAISGTGPRPGTSGVNKVLARYEEGGKAIDEYLAKLGVDVTSDAYRTSLYAGLQIPQGPQTAQFSGYAPQQTGGIADSLTSIAGGIPWLDMLKGSAPTPTSGTFGNMYQPGYRLPSGSNPIIKGGFVKRG